MCTPNEWHFYQSRGDEAPAVAAPETAESTQLLLEALEATNQTHPYAQHMLMMGADSERMCFPLSFLLCVPNAGGAVFFIKRQRAQDPQH